MANTLRTDLTFTVTGGRDAAEYDIELLVKYRFGESEFYIDDAQIVERDGIYIKYHEAPTWLWRVLEDDEALRNECATDWEGREQAAADDHADMLRRERQLGDL